VANREKRPAITLKDIVTSKQGVMRLGGSRAVVMTESAFTLMLRVINEYSPELLRYGLYDMGYRAGLDVAEGARQLADTPEQAFRYFVDIYEQTGYGNLEVVRFDLSKPEAVLRGRNLLEASAAEHSGLYRTPRAVDHYTRGMFAGLFSRLLGQEVICEELRCTYRGDDYCEFVVLPFGGAE
jgi:uncharacterized protein